MHKGAIVNARASPRQKKSPGPSSDENAVSLGCPDRKYVRESYHLPKYSMPPVPHQGNACILPRAGAGAACRGVPSRVHLSYSRGAVTTVG